MTDKEIWDLLLIEQREDGDGHPRTLFHGVTPLWRTRDGDGLSGQLPFDLRRGDRILIKRRTKGDR